MRFLFVFLWLIIYYEYTLIGPLTIGQLWKFPLFIIGFLYLITISISKNFKSVVSKIIVIRLIFLLLFIRLLLYEQNLSSIQFYINSIFFLLLFCYLEGSRVPKVKVEKFIYNLSVFLILSNVPFLLGLSQKTNAIELDRFGIENAKALSGLFYNVSVNYKILVFSSLFILNKLLKSRNFFDLIILSLGIVFILLTFTRLGFFSFIIGAFIIIYNYYNWSFKKLLSYSLIFITISVFIVSTNEIVKRRLVGGTTYRENTDFDFDTFTSYRLLVNGVALDQFVKDSPVYNIFGQGENRTIDRMVEGYNMNFIPHSKYLQYLCYSGVLGFLLILIEQKLLFKLVSRSKDVKYKYLLLALFLLEIIWHIPSHGSSFWGQLILGGVLYLNIPDENITNTL